jgi:hypothetical protein
MNETLYAETNTDAIRYATKYTCRDRGSTVVKVVRLQIGRSLVRSQMVLLEFLIDINPSDRTMALGSTQPLTEMVPEEYPGGKCGRCVGLTTLPPSCAVVTKSGNLNFLEPSGPLQVCNGIVLTLPLLNSHVCPFVAYFPWSYSERNPTF